MHCFTDIVETFLFVQYINAKIFLNYVPVRQRFIVLCCFFFVLALKKLSRSNFIENQDRTRKLNFSTPLTNVLQSVTVMLLQGNELENACL